MHVFACIRKQNRSTAVRLAGDSTALPSIRRVVMSEYLTFNLAPVCLLHKPIPIHSPARIFDASACLCFLF